jgi:hypothetical protein
MNERYEQLMAQAWIEFAPDAKAVTKRFAELIVKECVKLLPPEMTHGPDGRPLEQVFKQHFGVEL